MKTVFDDSWKNWIATNVNQGQDKDGIFKILLDEGYEFQAICTQMNYRPSVPVSQLINPFEAARNHSAQHTSNTGVKIDRNKLFIPNGSKLQSEELELYTLENFLEPGECGKLIARIQANLSQSTLSSFQPDQSYRTSKTCDLAKSKDPFVADIHDRICRLIGVDRRYAEEIQGQYYGVGQEFKAHTDYFETHEIQAHGARMGQRTYTVMIYLNDVAEGGETSFLNVGKSFKPQTGTAVIWSSLKPDGTPNPASLHQALPVKKGFKAVITSWFRSSSGMKEPPPMFTKERNEYVPNYTRVGFLKTAIPEDVFGRITEFYLANRDSAEDEHVPGDFIVQKNQKKSRKKKGRKSSAKPGSVLIDLSDELRREIHDVMKPEMEKWCGKQLDPTYVYGIREYKNAAILKSHRDRIDTHIISAIINVAQEVKKDWPLVIEDNYYRTHRVLLKPGEVIFYEGARLTHGRPVALYGARFANIFCHFKPRDYVPVVI